MTTRSKHITPQFESAFSSNESFEDLFNAQSLEKTFNEGAITSGKIVKIDPEYISIDVGLKMEGIVPVAEFGSDITSLTVGQDIEVYLEKKENRNGRMVLSREKVLREKMWEILAKAMESKTLVNGRIVGKVKGGFTVDLSGVMAFLPGSQVDVRPIKDPSPLMNFDQPFMVLKTDRKQGNIVVSRRAILEESNKEAKDEFLSNISEGSKLKGVVKNITDYGAFIELKPGIDGLLHITDITWGRINHPSECLRVGQEIDVVVIKFNEETKRVSLGMKQLESNPWNGLSLEFPKGSTHKGKITNITDYGAFIELKPGIEGLVHVSEIAWNKENVHPRKLVNIGQEVNFIVLEVDPEKHRVSLGMKQVTENPWKKFSDKFPVGTVVDGVVKNIVDFGLFVGLDGDVDGLIHVSDITWGENSLQELQKFKKDDVVKCKVLSLDVEKERVSLGIKQLANDPFENALSEINKGSIVTTTVVNVRDDGIEVTFADGIISFIKRSDLSNDKVEQRPERFAVGDRVDAKVISVDKVNRKLSLSIKALEADEQKKAIAEYGSTDSGASIGEILGAALSKANQGKKEAEN